MLKNKVDLLRHNQKSWDKQSREGSRWCTPVDSRTIEEAKKGQWEVMLTPLKVVPKDWFGNIADKDVLCLASGGGQQAPVLAAAGARVVSFDMSLEQLQKDARVAADCDLPLQTRQGDMADLGVLDDASFDLIFHPVANVFVSDVKIVWEECYRVLKQGGGLLSGFMNPLFFLFDADEAKRTKQLTVRYKLPYSDLKSLDEKRQRQLLERQIAFEFGHTLDDLIGGQIAAGFSIVGFYEDWWEDEATLLNKYAPTFMATRAVKE
jgi:SAM-dependent methyltransferase